MSTILLILNVPLSDKYHWHLLHVLIFRKSDILMVSRHYLIDKSKVHKIYTYTFYSQVMWHSSSSLYQISQFCYFYLINLFMYGHLPEIRSTSPKIRQFCDVDPLVWHAFILFVVSWCSIVNSLELSVVIELFKSCNVLLHYSFMY